MKFSSSHETISFCARKLLLLTSVQVGGYYCKILGAHFSWPHVFYTGSAVTEELYDATLRVILPPYG